MAAIAVSKERGKAHRTAGSGIRFYGTGAAASSDTLTTTAVAEHHRQRISYVSCVYSGAPTQAGVTVTIDSGLGAAYDTLLATGTANATTTVYAPDGDIWLMPGDAVLVTSPSGGGALTAAITVVVEEI